MLGSAALIAAWLAPNHYPPWTAFHGEAAAFAALCFFCMARALQARPVAIGRWAWLPCALMLLVAVQWQAGQVLYGGDALLSALYIFGAGLAGWLGAATHGQREPDSLDWFAGLVVAGAAASVLLGVMQWLRIEQLLGIFAAERGPDMRVYANLGQPNHLGTLCVMGCVLACWLRMQGRLRRWQFVALLAWLSIGTLLTESRAALASVLACGVLLLLRSRRAPGMRRTVLVWWGGLALGYLLLPHLDELLLLAPARGPELQVDSLRSEIWRQATAAIHAAPWLGHGWRQSLMALKQAALQVPGHVATDYAHNLELDLLVWVGVPLGGLLIALGAWWLLRAFRRIADARQLLLLAATVPFLVHSQFEFPFAYSYFLFPVAWLLGALGASQAADRPATPRRAGPDLRFVMLGLAMGCAALCIAVAIEYLAAEEDFRVMRFELRRVGHRPVGYDAPDLVLLTQLKELLEVGRMEPAAGLPAATIERMGDLSARYGWATLDLTYATTLGLNGRPQDATRELALIRAVYGQESAKDAFTLFRGYAASHPALSRVRIP